MNHRKLVVLAWTKLVLCWILGKLFPPKPSGKFTPYELRRSLQFQFRQQPDALPASYPAPRPRPNRFAAAAFITDRRPLPVIPSIRCSAPWCLLRSEWV
jgi:hypothetical protein